jgi:hypothetical protein
MGNIMDNFNLDVTARDRETLIDALNIVFSHHSVCVGYTVQDDPEGGQRMILLWNNPVVAKSYEATAFFPFPVRAKPGRDDVGRDLSKFQSRVPWLAELIEGWLAVTEYGKEPSHDGDNVKGFRLFTDRLGEVAGHRYAMCIIEPEWAWLGK